MLFHYYKHTEKEKFIKKYNIIMIYLLEEKIKFENYKSEFESIFFII